MYQESTCVFLEQPQFTYLCHLLCEFEAFKTLDCYTIHKQNCNTYEVGVAVYKTQAFRNLEYNIEKVPADLIILHGKGLNLGDLLYCVGLRAPRKNVIR